MSLLGVKYEVVGLVPGPILFRGRKYDLANLNDAQLEKLLSLQCPYVRKMEEAPPKKTKQRTEDTAS